MSFSRLLACFYINFILLLFYYSSFAVSVFCVCLYPVLGCRIELLSLLWLIYMPLMLYASIIGDIFGKPFKTKIPAVGEDPSKKKVPKPSEVSFQMVSGFPSIYGCLCVGAMVD